MGWKSNQDMAPTFPQNSEKDFYCKIAIVSALKPSRPEYTVTLPQFRGSNKKIYTIKKNTKMHDMKNEKNYVGFLLDKIWQILNRFSRAALS